MIDDSMRSDSPIDDLYIEFQHFWGYFRNRFFVFFWLVAIQATSSNKLLKVNLSFSWTRLCVTPLWQHAGRGTLKGGWHVC